MKLELSQKWDEQFLKLIDKSRMHSFDEADADHNKLLNRYVDVKPYDRSRIKLSRTKDTDYINANFVTLPKAARRYILTQGPLPETKGHFWLMVWEQKSNVIVMLNRVFEDLVKCEQYWPDSVNDTVEHEDVDLSVTLKSVKTVKHYTVREILLTDKLSAKSRTVLQFQYVVWPDHDQPGSATSLLRLLSDIRQTGGLDKMDEPAVIHCSAGIGRSGTFCLIDSVLCMVENQGSTEGIDIFGTLLEMRDFRMGLIQTPTQLKFAYISIIYGIKILEKANKLHPHISSVKDSISLDNTNNKQRVNGSSQQNSKPSRRNKKKQNRSNNNSGGPLNIFTKHLLVEALEEIDSDSADDLFYDAMKPLPNIKKPRNSYTGDDFNDVDEVNQNNSLANNGNNNCGHHNLLDQPSSPTTKAQMLTNAMHSLLTENSISLNPSSGSAQPEASQNTDSVLHRRRERELRNQRLAEKTMDIKNKMKAEELRRENYARRMAFLKKSAVYGGVIALVLSSIAYLYLQDNSS